ncbi:D-alanyl-lipoteichoic acid biosynthesis protein DltD [Clostridium sp. LY3-2]|uniref:D-alanyl-lipoteichoic acid biosynthesis protein DltD n=1 Tax=Clostridium sp. LY3-2 TaxID=2942482 RepID=UPI0021538669|nr:D-alanyl-lipoteichoic acid biosynthesis protein DltD [Clostridium sp. LY3-2]MCR6515567.1 D-alanyl-lipoteichoic acid biosynthesis protein DltD [Clostridium sp. LY3-2]
MKKILCFIIPIVIGIAFAFGLNKFLDYQNNKMMNDKNLVPLMSEYATDIKGKGVIINNKFLSEDSIMMLGASDLRKATKQHPTRYFNTNKNKNKVFTIGRPFTQQLQDAITLGSTNPDIKGKKVVLLESLQWFVHPEGVAPRDFQGRFSPIQFYTFLDNKDISKESKEFLCKRVNTLLEGSSEFKSEKIYAELYNDNSAIAKIKKVLLKPYFYLREKEVLLKEKGRLYLRLKKLKNKTPKDSELKKPFNWKKEQEQAIKDAKKRVKDAPLKLDKDYYNKTLKPNLKKLKNKYKGVNLLESKEMDDYKYFLDICKEQGADLTVVLMPCFPWYYDYAGISQKQRFEFYDVMGKLAKEKGFKVMDLRDKETEDYYLRDVMHLGTRGWLDVSEKLYKQYNEGQVYNR